MEICSFSLQLLFPHRPAHAQPGSPVAHNKHLNLWQPFCLTFLAGSLEDKYWSAAVYRILTHTSPRNQQES